MMAPSQSRAARPRSVAESLRDIVAEVFAAHADGWSVDEILLDKQRRQRFVARVRDQQSVAEADDVCMTLLRLRKAGELSASAHRRGTRPNPEARPAAEIAARLTTDRLGCTTDEILARDAPRDAFLAAAQRVHPEAEAYDLLKWMLNLRKARRLRPELLLRVVDWPREITVHSVRELRADESLLPEKPGVYLFRDHTGYLYVGEAKNLRKRLDEHLRASDRDGLAHYLERTGGEGLSIEIHAFAPQSPARRVAMRRAYESELIDSRNPKFNVRP
jgi:predicted GIY-YIG superfamily endonuclease